MVFLLKAALGAAWGYWIALWVQFKCHAALEGIWDLGVLEGGWSWNLLF